MQIIISPARPIYVTISTATLAAKAGAKFEPTFESLKQYRCPEWFVTPSSYLGALGSAMRPRNWRLVCAELVPRGHLQYEYHVV